MRKQSITSIIVLVCVTVIAATTVRAQNARRFLIDIPFQFVITGRTLPAGKYAVERIDPTKPNVVMLKNTGNDIVRLVITQRVEIEEMSTTSSLIFKRRGEEFYLFQIWVMGNSDGNQVPVANETDKRHKRCSSTSIRLRVNNERP